jgi:predicted DNA-binding protein (MmcQ/YjbR family)
MIDLEIIRSYCSQKKGVTEDFPFDDVTMVIKVGRKMFLLVNITRKPLQMNLKSDPLVAEGLRDKYQSVLPGYHMNKMHWNTIILDGTVPDNVIFSMIDDSYDLVYSGLKKSEREKIGK